MAVTNSLSICSYNMFGYRNGLSMIDELCNNHNIIAIQEHWLREEELVKLSRLHSDFNSWGASGMNSTLSITILKGRPFGGVGFLWHNSISNMIMPLGSSCDGRCIALKLHILNLEILIFNVYFPCFDNGAEYKDDITVLCAFMESCLIGTQHSDVIIMGDTNFDIVPNHTGFSILNSLLSSWNLEPCDNLVVGYSDAPSSPKCITHTYVNEALNQSSRIDHFFVSTRLKAHVLSASVIDCPAINMSDHRPIDIIIDLFSISGSAAGTICLPSGMGKQSTCAPQRL